MAESRCPVCNTPNPENQENCMVCGARLRVATEPLPPIRAGQEPTSKSTGELERTLPGWLRDLRSGEGSEPATQETQDAAPLSGESEKDDLLGGLSGLSASEEQPSQPPAAPADFLSGLSGMASDEDEEAPDWLKAIQGSLPGSQPPADSSSGSQLPESGSAVTGEGELSDWFTGEQQPAADEFSFQEPEPPAPAEETSEEVADWLRTLDAQPASTPAEGGIPAFTEPSAGMPDSGESPDWLADLGGESIPFDFSEQPAQAPASQPEADMSEWFAAEPQQPPAQPESAKDESQDWFANLEAGDAGEPFAMPSEPAPAEAQPAEVSDWLSGLGEDKGSQSGELEGFTFPEQQQPAESEPASSDGGMDWLNSLGAEESGGGIEGFEFPAAETPAAAEPAAGQPNLDWLSSLGEETPAGQSQEPGPAGLDEMPSWLSEGSEAAQPSPEKPAAVADETLDWLSSLGESAEAQPPAEEIPSFDFLDSEEPATPASESELPSWMASDEGKPSSPELPAEPQPESSLGDVSWLSDLGGEPGATSGAEAEPSIPEGELPSWLNEPGALPSTPAETPSWLTGGLSGLDETPPATEKPAEGSFEADLGGELPAFSFDEEPAQPSAPAFMGDTVAGQSENEAFSMEMPDWLSGISPAASPASQLGSAGEEEEAPAGELSPGELPSWVQSMRPVESVISDGGKTEEGVVESKGPLAGLRNVLPAASVELGIKKPPVYANKLALDEDQQAGATLLEAILAAEVTSAPIATKKSLISARVLRWVIALVMLLAAAIPAALNMQFAPSNRLIPPEALAASERLGNLPASAPVLVIFDFEPGLSGEMEAAASPVLEHLMLKGARLVFVSTSPSGPLLAERMLTIHQLGHNYQPDQQYVNLGYLPGGPAGIATFAETPVVIKYTVTNADAWNTPVLEGVSALKDFAAVIIVTDSVDTGRAWIEQSGAYLGETPILMVSSAQAEPIIRPYYDSGQIKGLVTGLVGGAAYEQIIGMPGLGREYWDSLSSSFLVAEVFIVFGSLWGVVSALRARREKKQQQDDEAVQ